MRFALVLLAAAAWAQQSAVRVLVAYHSESGNTAKFAEAVRKGAASVSGVTVSLKKAADVTDAEVITCDGIVFGAPVYWQSISADGKAFLDRVANAHQKAKANGDGRAAGVFVTAGAVSSGKDLARLTMIAAFLAMRFTIVGGVDPEGFGTLGPQATTGPGAPGLNEAALEEARVFGERVARAARQLRSGTVKP
jgi:NAD(P)H dehydrogenase (quinone)